MKLIKNKTNAIGVGGDYPYGDIRDDSGVFDGVPLDRELFADAIQFFERLMDKSGIVANGLPDNNNVSNGFQLYEAFRKVSRPYNVYTALISQSGINVPTAIVLENTTGIVNPTFTRSGNGIYNVNFSSAILTTNKTTLNFGPLTATTRHTAGSITSTSSVQIFSDNAGTLADGMFIKTLIEIKIYD